ncbi:MAG: hypothetical protein P8K68_01640 [Algibacter sp.]|uniref:hypothetical protein n=1 Tax=Algibacter sp. TaxID=1872428 RepID=UPI00260F590D|nr:hypothetical protein [Algibacter sp.]MDG1728317.1 hypothetical protein [Algibacter sp.]MDG2177474.1 hypothetical protein [Algibacter sp.]
MIYSFSKSDITRYIVLDHSLLIEEITSETICKLLGIDILDSKALGHNFGSLSFYQKVLLIKDVIGVDSEMAKKIEVFSQIRNKFAHLRKIETWRDFFSLSKTYSNIERNLKNWYQTEENIDLDFENNTRLLYFHLTEDLFRFLVKINSYYEDNQRKSKQEIHHNNALFEFMKKKLSDELGIDDIDEAYFKRYSDEIE